MDLTIALTQSVVPVADLYGQAINIEINKLILGHYGHESIKAGIPW